MRALFLLVSILWVFPSEYRALDIPLPNAVLIRGAPVGFSPPPQREKRAEKNNTASCGGHDYRPRRRNYCCNKCLAGYKVAADCSGDGQTTQCVPCDTGTYTDIPNNSKHCEACSSCVTQYGQIVLSDCTAAKNTQCGCPGGHFKEYSGQDFICKECTTCRNGTQLLQCHDDKDTICKCFHNFFFHDADKSCRPCSECEGPDCKDHCPNPVPAVRPEENNGVLVAVLGVVVVMFMVAVGICGVYTYYTRNHPSSSDTTGTNPQTTISIDHKQGESAKLLTLPGYTMEILHGEQQPTMDPTDRSLPLPDITEGTAPPCLNSPKVVYAIIEIIPMVRWREFVRRLGLSNHTIESCEQDYRHYRDAQYAMLQVWVTREGCPSAKRDQLFNVLREIKLGGCIERIEEHL